MHKRQMLTTMESYLINQARQILDEQSQRYVQYVFSRPTSPYPEVFTIRIYQGDCITIGTPGESIKRASSLEEAIEYVTHRGAHFNRMS